MRTDFAFSGVGGSERFLPVAAIEEDDGRALEATRGFEAWVINDPIEDIRAVSEFVPTREEVNQALALACRTRKNAIERPVWADGDVMQELVHGFARASVRTIKQMIAQWLRPRGVG